MSRLSLFFRRSLLPAGVAIALSLGAGQALAAPVALGCPSEVPGSQGLCPGDPGACHQACLDIGGVLGICTGTGNTCCACLF